MSESMTLKCPSCLVLIMVSTCELSLHEGFGPPLFTEVPVPSQESERTCICVLILPLSAIFCLDYEIVSTFIFFSLYSWTSICLYTMSSYNDCCHQILLILECIMIFSMTHNHVNGILINKNSYIRYIENYYFCDFIL